MGQINWRFCKNCCCMFFDAAPTKGSCPAGGGHVAQGLMFDLPHDVPETDKAQKDWRFCSKCCSMFFNASFDPSVCPAGGGHEAQGVNFVLPHDVPGQQQDWRFCHKCHSMFFQPTAGVCAAGGEHRADGSFDFVLPSSLKPKNPIESTLLVQQSDVKISDRWVRLEMQSPGEF